MKPIGYFCNSTPEIKNLIADYGDQLDRMTKEAKHGLRFVLAGKIYGFETGAFSSAVPLTDIVEGVLGTPDYETHHDLADVLVTLDEISSSEALKLIAFLSQ